MEAPLCQADRLPQPLAAPLRILTHQCERHLEHGRQGEGAVEERDAVDEERLARRRVPVPVPIPDSVVLLLGYQQPVDGAVRILGGVEQHLAIGLGAHLHLGLPWPGFTAPAAQAAAAAAS